MTAVQRFVVRAKPLPAHSEYFEWQTATLVLFVGDSDRTQAQRRAEGEVRHRGWCILEFLERSTLIEERVQEVGGEVLEAYRAAESGNPFFLETLDVPAFHTKKYGQLGPPRLNEAFVDRVVTAAEGERIPTDPSDPAQPKQADYRIGNLILELKDIQEDGLLVETRQQKLAELFGSFAWPGETTELDPAMLDEQSLRRYREIVGAPINRKLKEARPQLRSTLNRLSDRRLVGGVILLNSGFGNLDSSTLFEYASHLVRDSRTIRVVACLSSHTVTNGFDTNVVFTFDPVRPRRRWLKKLRDAWYDEIGTLMTKWAGSGFLPPETSSEPLKPLVFEAGDKRFSRLPPGIPNSLRSDA